MSKATCPKNQEVVGNCNERWKSTDKTTKFDHHEQVTDYGYVEKVFANLRRKMMRTEDDEMFDLLKTNSFFWCGDSSCRQRESPIQKGLEDEMNLIVCQNREVWRDQNVV